MSSNSLFLEANATTSDVSLSTTRIYNLRLSDINSIMFGPGYAWMFLREGKYCLVLRNGEDESLDQVQIYDNPEIFTEDPIFFANCSTDIIRDFMDKISDNDNIVKVDIPGSLPCYRTYLTTTETHNLAQRTSSALT